MSQATLQTVSTVSDDVSHALRDGVIVALSLSFAAFVLFLVTCIVLVKMTGSRKVLSNFGDALRGFFRRREKGKKASPGQGAGP